MKQGKLLVDFFKMVASYEKQESTTTDDINTIILNVGVLEEYENMSEAFQMGFALLLEEEYTRYKERAEIVRKQRLDGLEKARAAKAGNRVAADQQKAAAIEETALETAIRQQRELKAQIIEKRQNRQQRAIAADKDRESDYVIINGERYSKVQ